MNFAIVGTNFISDNFCLAAKRVPDAHVVAVYSRKEQTGNEFAKKHGIVNIYTHFSDMLADKSIDAVYIASPTMCHAEQAILALDAGKNVLCEKMIAATYGEFLKMKEAKLSSGKNLIEAMRPDFDEILKSVSKEVKKLGKIRTVSLEYCQYSSRYDKFKAGEILNAFDPNIKNSALADIGIYPLHFAISIFGNPEKIKSTGDFLHNGFLGSGTTVLNYTDFDVTIKYSKIHEGENVSRIVGDGGEILFDRINEPSYYTLKLSENNVKTYHAMDDKSNMVDEIKTFIKICKGDKALGERLLSVTEKTMAAVDNIYRSLGIDFN